jgi:hypothetical protein
VQPPTWRCCCLAATRDALSHSRNTRPQSTTAHHAPARMPRYPALPSTHCLGQCAAGLQSGRRDDNNKIVVYRTDKGIAAHRAAPPPVRDATAERCSIQPPAPGSSHPYHVHFAPGVLSWDIGNLGNSPASSQKIAPMASVRAVCPAGAWHDKSTTFLFAPTAFPRAWYFFSSRDCVGVGWRLWPIASGLAALAGSRCAWLGLFLVLTKAGVKPSAAVCLPLHRLHRPRLMHRANVQSLRQTTE